MPCDGIALQRAEEERRQRELDELETLLNNGAAQVVVNAMGEREIVGWERDLTVRGHWHDDCAIRAMEAKGYVFDTQTQSQTGWLTN